MMFECRYARMQFDIDLWNDRDDYDTTIERKGYTFKIREVDNIAAYRNKVERIEVTEVIVRK